jgi:hypothetical protein
MDRSPLPLQKNCSHRKSSRVVFDFRLATATAAVKKLPSALRDPGWQISFLTD